LRWPYVPTVRSVKGREGTSRVTSTRLASLRRGRCTSFPTGRTTTGREPNPVSVPVRLIAHYPDGNSVETTVQIELQPVGAKAWPLARLLLAISSSTRPCVGTSRSRREVVAHRDRAAAAPCSRRARGARPCSAATHRGRRPKSGLLRAPSPPYGGRDSCRRPEHAVRREDRRRRAHRRPYVATGHHRSPAHRPIMSASRKELPLIRRRRRRAPAEASAGAGAVLPQALPPSARAAERQRR
jgi:hypothetical protein